MAKKIFIPVIIMSIFALAMFTQCSSTNEKKGIDSTAVSQKDVVEVYYFHGDRRCKTCIAVGEQSKKAVEENFKDEILKKKVSFQEVNVDRKENDSLATKFQVYGSGLYIRSVKSGKETIEDLTELAFMNALENPDTLISTIKTKVRKGL
jgi:thiol-disulfide isomerase/thioredoxin